MSKKKDKGGKKQEEFKFDFNSNQQSGEAKKEGYQSVLDFSGKDAPMLSQFQKHLERSLVGQSSSYFESLPKQVQERIKALKFLHSQRLKLEKDFNKELQELEKKYDSLYQPLIDRRHDIVGGVVEPKPEELVEEKKEEDVKKAEDKKEEGEQKVEPTKVEQDVKGVPEFWLLALKHHEDFSAMITEADEAALKHLTDIRVGSATEHSPDSFTLEFYFSENEFFDNAVIKKTYVLKENSADGEMMYDHVDSTDINWKPNKNLTVKKVTKQQKKKGGRGRGGKQAKGGPTQTITVEEPTESFFYFFKPESAYAVYGGGMEMEDEDEMDDGGLGDYLELDYELGLELKEKIIPHAVMFYTGENAAFDDEDEEEEDEDEEQDENEEEEEVDVEYEPPKEQQAGAQQPECKQQ